MIVLETRSEVKVTKNGTDTRCMHPHSKFGIPTSNKIRDMHRTCRTDVRGWTDTTDGQCDYYMLLKVPFGV